MGEFEKRSKRYPTDLTDQEWLFIQPFPRAVPRREAESMTNQHDVLEALH
jgi:transposase